MKITSGALIVALMLCSFSVFSQNISISNDPASVADGSAMLDIRSTDKGLLIPRMTAAQRIAISNPAKGLLVYQSDLDSGFYYNAGLPASPQWISLQSQLTGWSTKGNAGTDSAVHFIGTTDMMPVMFRYNNVRSGIIDSMRFQTALGYKALSAVVDGTDNTAMGFKALEANTSGYDNTALGSSTLRSNTTGAHNTATGFFALRNNQTGTDNNATGSLALVNNTTGSYNNAMGVQALTANTVGDSNTAVGHRALYSNTTGGNNTAIGSRVLTNNTTGNHNTALGEGAMTNNTLGRNNVAGGNYSLFFNGVGEENVALGNLALFNNNGSGNTANGYRAMYSNITGFSNTATGHGALQGNGVGSYNTAVGGSAFASNISGQYNTAIGYGTFTTAGNLSNATAIGALATVACSNCMVLGNGVNVGIGNSTPNAKLTVEGTENSGNGNNAAILLRNSAASPANHWVLRAGGTGTLTPNGGFSIADNSNYRFMITSNGNVGIGAGVPAARLDVIGANGWDLVNTEGDVRIGDANYRLKIGVALGGGGAGAVGIMQYGSAGGYNVMSLGAQGNYMLYLNGNLNRVGIGTDNPSQKLHVVGNICYTGSIAACSDIRYKTNFHSIENALQKITALRGFYYDWDNAKFPAMHFDDQRQLGFSAQEVERLFPELVLTDNKGYKSVDYGRLTPVLVEAMKEQQAEIDTLKNQLSELQEAFEDLKKALRK